MNPRQLERYSFLWSEVRLIIAAGALFIGGVPPILVILPAASFTGVFLVLKVAWIISGVASAYLLYQWYTHGQRVFGGKNNYDVVAFFVSVVSGLNLGLTGLLGSNIGMSIAPSPVLFTVTALAYLATAAYLYKRWSAHGQKIFH